MRTDTGPPATTRLEGRCPCCGTILPSRAERRLTILDAMVMVVATAGALALARPNLQSGNLAHPAWAGYLEASIGVLVAWTPTALWLRLRRPRPTLRRLARQPGFAAGVAGTAVLGLGVAALVLLALIRVARQGMVARMGQSSSPSDPLW